MVFYNKKHENIGINQKIKKEGFDVRQYNKLAAHPPKMNNNKRYIDKFVVNKEIPNVLFKLNTPDGELSIDLNETVNRIYEESKGNDVKKILKKGNYRNKTLLQVVDIFQGFAIGFLLDDYDMDSSKRIKDILHKANQRKNHLFLKVEDKEVARHFEVVLSSHNEETPFFLINNETKEKESFKRRDFIEYLLFNEDYIKEVI